MRKHEDASRKRIESAVMVAMPNGMAFFIRPNLGRYVVCLARDLGATVTSVVVPEHVKLIDLKKMVECLSDKSYRTPIIQFSKTGVIYDPAVQCRRKSIGDEVGEFARSELLAGKQVSVKDLCDKFNSSMCSESSVRRYFAKARASLVREGNCLGKIGTKYFLKGGGDAK